MSVSTAAGRPVGHLDDGAIAPNPLGLPDGVAGHEQADGGVVDGEEVLEGGPDLVGGWPVRERDEDGCAVDREDEVDRAGGAIPARDGRWRVAAVGGLDAVGEPPGVVEGGEVGEGGLAVAIPEHCAMVTVVECRCDAGVSEIQANRAWAGVVVLGDGGEEVQVGERGEVSVAEGASVDVEQIDEALIPDGRGAVVAGGNGAEPFEVGDGADGLEVGDLLVDCGPDSLARVS
jgi:hypothetical protein